MLLVFLASFSCNQQSMLAVEDVPCNVHNVFDKNKPDSHSSALLAHLRCIFTEIRTERCKHTAKMFCKKMGEV